jgi:Tfp pilus assembly protein PilX
MKTNSSVNRHPDPRFSNERGIALVTTLLLLMLLTAVTIGMVIAASSDELISGYNRNIRSTFYAGDSGLNIARQAMVNQVLAAVPTTVTNRSSQPLPTNLTDTTSGGTTTPGTVSYGILSSYGSSNVSINSGSAAGSWPGKYKITSAGFSLGSCSVTGGTGASPTCASPCSGVACTTLQANAITGYTYNYNYSISAAAMSNSSEQASLTDNGTITVNVNFTPPAGTLTSFASYGFFVDHYNICDGSYLVPGTITGPVFSNGTWNFGTSGSYTFTDPVGAHLANLGYQFSSTCKQSSSGSSTSSGVTIAPTFQSGFQLGQTAIALPQNSFSQKQAVLDGVGAPPACTTSPCWDSAMNAALKKADPAQSYPSGGASSGVFMPYSTVAGTGVGECDSVAPPCIKGGGIYVKGNAAVTLTASTGTGPLAGHSLQVVTVVQSGTTSTVTIDLTSNTTTFAQGSSSTTINGVPFDASGATTREGAMIYVDGSITSLKGPGSNNPAIQDGSAVTVTANGNITITDDILYKTKPVTMTQNEVPGTPPSTLKSGYDNGQVLGIYTNVGDIQLNNCSGCGNLEIDASLATIANGGTGGLVNTGSSINTLTILGGRIQNNIKNINATTRNVIYDRRFANNFAPPWFPSTTITPTGVSGTTVPPPTVTRLQWLNKTPY